MSLETKITESLKEAMRAKDKNALNALRAIKSAILLAKTDKGAGELDEKGEIALLQRLKKQRKESADIYNAQGRSELVQEEEAQLEIIERFLPAQMSESELERNLQEIIEEVNASGPQDMGKVMGAASKKLAGQADGKAISDKVKELLSGN